MRPVRRAVTALALVVLTLAAACGGDDGGRTVVLVSHDSFNIPRQVLRSFETASGTRVRVRKAGDAGSALNQVILTKDDPIGDVFFGVDNTFLSRALEAGVFVRFRPRNLGTVRRDLLADRTGRLTPVDFGDVCVNADRRWFEARDLPIPVTLEDLTRDAYRGLLVVQNPATSSPGLAFLLATVARFGDPGWRDYWRALRANDVKVVEGWEQAYNTEFSGSAGKGPRPLVVSYGSSPAAEVYYADPRPGVAPTAVLPDTCFRQVEFAGVLRGARNPEGARRLVTFMLTEEFQRAVPLSMWVFPARRGTPLPEVFRQFALAPTRSLRLPPAEIAANRDRWIDRWTETVLR